MVAQYQILDRIGTTAGSHLHRARHVADGAPAVLKLPESENIPAHAARFRREYARLRLGLQFAHILGGLHAAHVVHRDVRPANLMLLDLHGGLEPRLSNRHQRARRTTRRPVTAPISPVSKPGA
jgi:hypothetical protein